MVTNIQKLLVLLIYLLILAPKLAVAVPCDTGDINENCTQFGFLDGHVVATPTGMPMANHIFIYPRVDPADSKIKLYIKDSSGVISSSGGTTVIDNLITQSAIFALSANQGYVLDQKTIQNSSDIDDIQDELITINSDILVIESDILDIQGDIANIPPPTTPTIVIDNLGSNSATDALSANQGRILNNSLNTKVSSSIVPPAPGVTLPASVVGGAGPNLPPVCDGNTGSWGTIGHNGYVVCAIAASATPFNTITIDAVNGHAPEGYTLQVSPNGSSWSTVYSYGGGLPNAWTHYYSNLSSYGPLKYVQLINVRGRNAPFTPENPQVNEIQIVSYVAPLSTTNKVAIYTDTVGKTIGSTDWTVPLAAGTNGQVLTSNGTNAVWTTGSGGGNVVGPASSVAGKPALFSNNTGKLLKDDSGALFTTGGALDLNGNSAYLSIYDSSYNESSTLWTNSIAFTNPLFNSLSLVQSSSQSVTYSLTFPPTAPAANQILQSNSSGSLSWINTPSGGGATVVIDALNSTSTTSALSANQGRILDGRVTTNTTNITNLQGTSHTHANKPALDVVKNNGTTTEFLSGAGTYLTPAGGAAIVVIDALNSTSTTAALSANQGRILDGRVTTNTTNITSNTNAITTLQGQTHTHANKALLDTLKTTGPATDFLSADGTYKAPAGGGAATVVIDALNSTSTTAALSANQGKVLNDTKVTGPASSNDFRIPSFNGTTGKLLRQTGVSYNSGLLSIGGNNDLASGRVEAYSGDAQEYGHYGFNWIVFKRPNNNTLTISAPTAPSSNITIKLPTTQAANNQILQSDATGQLSWIATPSAGTPTVVIDALNSTSTTSALSANQGRVLNEKVPLTTWATGQAYKIGEIKNSGSDNNWLFKVATDHTSANVPADFKAGKLLAISPPLITTGVQAGGAVSLAGAVATVQSGTGYIAKYSQSPSAYPLITIVEWATQTKTFAPATGIHTLYIDANGQLISVAGSGSSARAAQDDSIAVGIIDFSLNKTYARATYPTNPVGQLRGMAFFFGGMTKGLSYTGKVDLSLSRTAYEVYSWGTNSTVDRPYTPNTTSHPAIATVNFYEYNKTGLISPTIKNNLRTVYEEANGTLTPLGGARWGFARIYTTLHDEDYVMYSQAHYPDEKTAKDAAVSSAFVKPTDLDLTKFSSWVVFKGNDLDFTDNPVITCEPFGCDKIGTVGGGSGGGAGDVLGPAGGTFDGEISVFADTSGKVIKSSGIDSDSLFVANGVVPTANKVMLFAGGGATGLGLQTSDYTFPDSSCPNGQILKSDGTNFTCQDDFGGAATVVIDALNSTSTTAALSANQGRILDGKITPLTTASHSHTNKTLLDSLISNGAATSFLAADGTYKTPVDTNSITVVEDLLTSVSAINALSANQGRILKGLVDTNTSNIATQGTSITALQGTSHSHTNKATLDVVKNNGTTAEFLSGAGTYVTPSIPAAVTVVDNLTSTSTTSALSANQGKVLNDTKVTGPASSIDNYIARFNGTTGKLIKGGSVGTLDNNGYLSIVGITPILKLDDGTSSGWYSQNQIRFYNANGNTFDLKPPLTTSSNYSIRFPNNPPTINQLLQSDASGNLSWINTPTASTATGDVSSTGASSSDGGIPTYSGTGGKTIKYDSSLLYSGGNIYLGGSGIGTAGFVLRGGTSGQIIFKGAATTPGYTLTLPSAAPAATQILQSDGSGNLSWIPTPTASTATGDVIAPATTPQDYIPVWSSTAKTLRNVQNLGLDGEYFFYSDTTGLNLTSLSATSPADKSFWARVQTSGSSQNSTAKIGATNDTSIISLNTRDNAGNYFPKIEGIVSGLTGNSTFQIGDTGNGFPSLIFKTGQGSFIIQKPWGASTAQTWNLPTALPTANQVLTATAVTAPTVTLAWSTPSSVTVVDNLTTNSPTSALSAAQGVVLKGMIDTHTTNIATNATNITTLQGTSHSHANKTVLDTLPSAVCTTVGDILKWTGSAFTCQADSGGTGDVIGNGTPFDNAIPRYIGTDGKNIQPTTVLIDDTNNIIAPATISAVGQIWSTVYTDTDVTPITIDWNNGNNQITATSCGSTTFTNMNDGGVYSLVYKGASGNLCSFTGGGYTYHYPLGHTNVPASKHSLYTFTRLGNDVYIGWNPGI